LKRIYLLLVGLLSLNFLSAQTVKDSVQLRNFYDLSLLDGQSYEWLDALSNEIGSRLSGSTGAEKAVQWAKEELEGIGLDKVWLQPVMVPKWERGAPEKAFIEGVDTKVDVPVCALGGSIATKPSGITAEVIEVQGLDDLAKYGEDRIKGKIVFYNRPMQADLIQTFNAYGGCVDQRYSGAKEAAKYGAVGVIVRSMNLRMDDLPHTGAMSYGDLPNEQRIPAAAISTNGAALLSKMLKKDEKTQFYLKMNCKNYEEDVPSFNVIGEITGSEKPNEFMVVGGHLDSWDLGDGSHDDGAGVVQSMEVLRLMKAANYKPKHSIRVVLFMNEENGLRGGTEYAKVAKEEGEKHVFALESDAGGFTPRGFSFDADAANFAQVQSWIPLFKPYLIHFFELGGSGADVGPLKEEGTVLAGLRPDSQRYFDHHHASNDTFDAVNKRELELGAATMTSLVYLFDTYGVKPAIPNRQPLKK